MILHHLLITYFYYITNQTGTENPKYESHRQSPKYKNKTNFHFRSILYKPGDFWYEYISLIWIWFRQYSYYFPLNSKNILHFMHTKYNMNYFLFQNNNQRKFRTQTSDNMERWKAEKREREKERKRERERERKREREKERERKREGSVERRVRSNETKITLPL